MVTTTDLFERAAEIEETVAAQTQVKKKKLEFKRFLESVAETRTEQAEQVYEVFRDWIHMRRRADVLEVLDELLSEPSEDPEVAVIGEEPYTLRKIRDEIAEGTVLGESFLESAAEQLPRIKAKIGESGPNDD